MESVPTSLLCLSLWCVGGAVLLGSAGSILLRAHLLPDSLLPPGSWAQGGAARGLGAASWLLPPVTHPSSLLLLLAASLLLGRWVWRQLTEPLELLRSPEEVGYIPERGRTRYQTFNDIRRRRKKGDLPPVYPNGWFHVLEAHLLRPGEVRNITALGEQIAVYRTNDDKVYVVDAYCPHLGANLAVGGQVVGDCIECPFHGWQFRGEDGKCAKIPYAEKVPDFAKIKTWPSCEINGMIFVWYHCDGVDPTWSIPEQEEITTKEWVYRGRTQHFVNAHIEAQWKPEPAPNKHCSQMFLEHAIYFFGKHFPLLDVNVVARQVGPGLVFLNFNHSFLGCGVILHCVTPMEPLLQKVSHCIYYQKNVPALIPKFILKTECIQFERDVMIWNNKKYISKPLLVTEDSAIQRHRRWFAQFYSVNSPQLTFQQEALEW
ncbi:cholesterol 7-desaturase nvd-like isoform X2 [Ascaphus truei]|uniref:cholesterol 7-desaturase nvd-like isoform X2 n=1 Tax=Ascaphus truei TaxID=8439 RepID=UPI003F5ACC16